MAEAAHQDQFEYLGLGYLLLGAAWDSNRGPSAQATATATPAPFITIYKSCLLMHNYLAMDT